MSFANCVHDSPLITDRVIKSLITEIHDQRKLKIFTQNCDEGLGQQIIAGKKSFFQTLGSELNLFNAWQQIRRWGECLVGYYQNITIDTELDRPDNGDHLADQGSIPRREQVCRRSSLPIWWDSHMLRVKVLPSENSSCFTLLQINCNNAPICIKWLCFNTSLMKALGQQTVSVHFCQQVSDFLAYRHRCTLA